MRRNAAGCCPSWKAVLIAAAVMVMAAFPVFAKVSFGNLDVNDEDGLLFSARLEVPGTPQYQSLFRARLGRTGADGSPELLTCYPERMELLSKGRVLQVRNRYGTAWYAVGSGTLRWLSVAGGIPVDYARTGPVRVSPDGRWACFIQQTGHAVGRLVLQNVQTQEIRVLVEKAAFSYEDIGAKWAPDSAALLYEDSGGVYFATPDAVFSSILPPASFRRIGPGSISSVQWAGDGRLIYISRDIIYSIQQNELYTRGLYAALVGSGAIVGRLPAPFDPLHDQFWCDDSGRQIVVVTPDKMAGYYTVQSPGGYGFVTVNGMYPLTAIRGSPLGYMVFWTEEKKPVLWVDYLGYETGKKGSSVYTLQKEQTLLLEIKGSVRPQLSPDKRHVAFSGGTSMYVYDTTSWYQTARITGERVVSFVWASSSSLYVGGEDTVFRWAIPDAALALAPAGGGVGGSRTVLFLSSAASACWDGGQVVARTGSGQDAYRYEPATNCWTPLPQDGASAGTPREKNGRYRVFTGIARNKRYGNAIFVRSLSGPVVTYPLYPETEEPCGELPRVALVFDAVNAAEGLARVLAVLDEFGLRGTFFINGEFIRRYPLETREIVAAGYECASGFYSDADITDNSFVVDADFIRRGLARNEDEFFAATGAELSLLWHAPRYHADRLARRAGEEAGYRYVDAFTDYTDRMGFEDGPAYGGSVDYLSAADVIDRLTDSLRDGLIIPVDVGEINGTRRDFLYEKFDLLVAAILDHGYQIVDVRELVDARP